MHRRERDFAGADKAVAVDRLVDLSAVGGEEAGAVHGLLAYQHRRHDGAKALGADDGEAVLHERELQQHEVALEVGETRAADLGAALHVDEVERKAEVQVVLDLEVELARLTDVAQHDGVLFAAVGDVGERDVGDLEEDRLEALLDAGELGLALLDRVAQRAHGGDRLRRRRRRPS